MEPETNTFPRWMKAVMAAAMLVVLAGGAWFYKAQEAQLRRQVEDQLTAIARIKVGQIVGWRAERLGDAAVLTESPFFSECVAQFMTGSRPEAEAELRSHLRSLQHHYHYSDILLVDPEGRTRLSLNGDKESCSVYSQVLTIAFPEHRPVFTDLHVGPKKPAPHFSVVAPIFAGQGLSQEPLGAVVLESVASEFLYPLIQQWPTLSKTAETLLVERDGDGVLFMNELRHQSDTALKLRIPLSRTEVPAVMAVLGRQGVVDGTDYRGVKAVSAVLPVSDSPWFMVAKMDAAEAFSEWRFRSGLILALLLGCVALAGALLLTAWQRNRKSHYRAIYQSEARLRASVERHSITLKSIGDGVIVTDAEGRVELLNSVAESLTGWNTGEAAGRPVAEIFRIINEETREVVENPVMRVLREGMVVGLANHTLLISRDGTERTIVDSGAPISDDSGRITGVVLVFRDQTAERSVQRLNEIRLRLIEYALTHSLDDVLSNALDEVGGIVQSPIGFYHFVETDQKTLSLQQWSTRTLKEFCRAESKERHYSIDQAGVWVDCVQQKKPVVHNDYASLPHRKGMPEGHAGVVRELVVPVLRQGKVVAILGVGNKPVDYNETDVETVAFLADLTWHIVERKRAEAERERLMAAIDQAGEMVCITDPDGTIQYVNPAFETVTGFSREEVIGQNPRIQNSGKQDEAFYQEMRATLSGGRTWKGRMVNKRKDGTLYTEDATISPVCDADGRILSFVAVKRDITEHLRLTAQFQQAQKMESVGRLAGGVAHDYNNMLSVIIGFSELALGKTNPSQPIHADLVEILLAARRSAEITRQLLAFARSQTIAPEVLDLNGTIEGMLKMLRRLIGEDIDLAWLPDTDLWPVRMDPAQIDQILANLCVNARDAITDIGKVTIETENITFDAAYCADHPGFLPGEHVMLAVSDNGCGMDEETRNHLFEPFFTTKEVGKGTGLGLATVYGIVKQNDGFINVYSEPGAGTTFKIYLPRHAGLGIQKKVESAVTTPLSQDETVLLVEDEVSILKMSSMMLESLGYKVLAANDPDEGERLAVEHEGEIHLLMTDVVMPGMNGRDLAKRLQAVRPAMKCLFMSGYTADVIAHRGVLDEGVNFIQKPFSKKELAGKVRRALEGNE
jgi:two-component system, cell cycle sensor histidine kinase and response regulator CckA